MTSDLQRWSREVAEDPGSASFVRLARAYRRQGRREAARNVVLGGLRANPHHVGGHALLALLHIEAGEREPARDEWETALRLDPGNFEASRGLGFLALERGDLPAARRHLEQARNVRPGDPAVQQAFEVLIRREDRAQTTRADPRGAPARAAPGSATAAPAPPAPAPPAPAPPAPAPQKPDSATPTAAPGVEPPGADQARPLDRGDGVAGAVDEDGDAARTDVAGDPKELFASLAADSPLLGTVLLDGRGLVLAGRIDGGGQDDLLGGLLSSAVVEAARTARIMGLGRWEGMLMETDQLLLHARALEGTEDGATVVVVTRPGTPAGWVVRAARRAHALAADYLREATP